MKRMQIIIIVAVVIVGGVLAVLLTGRKSCSSLSELQCKKDDRCLSVLVPNKCDNPPCSPAAVFKECKDKSD
ncbi:MAG: hypothetical protein V1907_03400 [Candidatus Kerfeldbacteria bacterium]